MTEAELVILQEMIQKSVSSADTFNKVWIAGAAVGVSILGIIVSSISQLLISFWQRRAQDGLARRQADDQKNTVAQQLAMQELASRRLAVANIGAKRQIWIDNLREEISEYLAIWRDIAWRWDAILGESSKKKFN